MLGWLWLKGKASHLLLTLHAKVTLGNTLTLKLLQMHSLEPEC